MNITFISTLTAASLVVVTGCAGTEPRPPGTDGPGPAAGGGSGPYLVSLSTMTTSDMPSSYSAVVPTLDDATDGRVRMGIETAGYVTPSSHGGAVYMPGGATPQITRYTVDASGKFAASGVVSFAALGVKSVRKGPVIGVDMISPDKAYYYNDTTYQIFVWNPRTMEVTGKTIDLAAVLRADIPAGWNPQVFLTYGDGFAKQRGNRLFIPVSWRNWNAPDVFYRSAGLLVIDTDNDKLVHLLRDDRLADSIYTVTVGSGDLYLFTGGFGVSYQRILGNAARGGALRVGNGQDTFDPAYYLDLDAAVGNRPASTPVWAGGTSVYVRAFHEERQPITAELQADPSALISQEAWRYWKVDLEGVQPAREVTELPWSSTSGYFYQIPEEDRLFLGVMAANFSNTRLYQATPSGFVESIQVTGSLDVISRLDRAH
jgi:hypothetical protein